MRPSRFTKVQIKPTRGAAAAAPTLTIDGSLRVLKDQPTTLFDVYLPVGGRAGGVIFTTVEASDGTDIQAMTSMTTYSGVNKAGTITTTFTNPALADAKTATGTSTLTIAFTAVNGTNKFTVSLTPTGSLTETIYDVTFFVLGIIGEVTLVNP